jgi:hypothetical protein
MRGRLTSEEPAFLITGLRLNRKSQYPSASPRLTSPTLEATLKVYISEMQELLDRATSIAKAANASAEAGNVNKAIEIALDIEQLIYEVNTFLNAASLIHRIVRS